MKAWARVSWLPALIAATCMIAPARANDRDWLWCIGGQGIGHNLQIAGCTSVIQSGDEAPRNLAIAFNNRGIAYARKGEHVRAIRDWDQAIRLKPDFADAFANRGIAYHDKGSYDRAIEDYDRAIRLEPNLARAFNNRGEAYRRKGNSARAIADYDRAVHLDPDYALAFYNRGRTYKDRREFDRAIEDYDEAIRLKPDYADALNSRCWARAITGKRLNLALGDCDEVLRLRPDAWFALDSRALVCFRLGRFADAVADATAALAANPDSAGSFYVRGVAKRRLGDPSSGNLDIAAAKVIDLNIAREYAAYGVVP